MPRKLQSQELAPPAFIARIKSKMEIDHIGVTELARIIKVSHPTVVDLVTYGKKPSFDTCVAISPWLGQSPLSTLFEAGLFSQLSKQELTSLEKEIKLEDWMNLINQLPIDEQEEVRQIIEMKIDRRQKNEQSERAANRKDGRVKK